MAYRALGDSEQARDHLARQTPAGIRPQDPRLTAIDELRRGERLHSQRGRLALRAGDVTGAIESFRRAVEASPASAGARVNLAAALASAGENEASIEELRRALELDPENATALFNLGSLLLARGDLPGARAALEAAIERRPEDGEAHRLLADVARASGDWGAALELSARSIELEPEREEAWLGRAETFLRMDRYAEAVAVLEEGHRRFPEWGRLAHALARALAAIPDRGLRDGARSLDLAGRVFEAAPVAAHAETMALALAELDRCGEAADWQRRAVGLARQSGDEASALRLEALTETYASRAICRPP
jgi:tetratricopeptide (TPR) repeat protein